MHIFHAHIRKACGNTSSFQVYDLNDNLYTASLTKNNTFCGGFKNEKSLES